MGRGSVCTWQDYGRRSSANMQQFSSSRAEFMTDDIEYKRRDGWFLSYTRLAAVIVVFIIGVIAAGFLGWYINYLQTTTPTESLSLIDDEIEENEIVDITITPFVHPLKYTLDLTPVFDGNLVSRMEGRVVIEFRVEGTDSLHKLFLNAKNITVTGYNLTSLHEEDGTMQLKRRRRENDTDEVDSAGSQDSETTVPLETLTTYEVEINILEYNIDDEKELHTIELDEDIGEGNYTLGIDYEVSLDPDAFYTANFNQSGGEKWLMGTRLRPLGARSLLPVFDDARSKSLFSVSVARPKEMRVLSNMPLRTSRDITENFTVDVFEETPLLSPSNLALAIGHIELLAETTINATLTGTFYGDSKSRLQGLYLVGKLEPAVITLIDMFSMAYPLPKLDLLDLPAEIDGNIGKPGLISLKRSVFRTDEQSAVATKSDALKDLVYVLGQQWLGGVVNLDWIDAWILDGVLSHIQYQLVEKIDSSLISSNSFLTEVQLDSMEIDGYAISRSLEMNLNSFYDSRFNNRDAKGACLIRMLHGAINETAFRSGYRNFIARWKYDTANAVEFWDVIAENAHGLPAEVPLTKLMAPWISQGGYPIVVVTRNYEKGTAVVSQQRFTYDASVVESEHLWHIPLTYTAGEGNWSDPRTTWFKSEKEISFDNFGRHGSWVLFNINKTGYYRVHYDEENWMLLKAALEENHELFPPETKASLIDDVFSLAAVGLAKYETAFDFIKYMQMKERHYAPWGALMRQVFKLNRLLYQTSAFSSFQEFMLQFVSPLYDEMKFRLEEGTRLTLIAVQMACAFEHPECLNWFRTIFLNLNVNIDIGSFMPSYMHEVFYCTIARYGTRKEWIYFAERTPVIADAKEKEQLLSSFSCFQAPWILQTILNEILHGKLFTEEEASIILNAFPQNPAAAQASFKFVRTNWPEIVERYPKSYGLLKSFAFSMFNGLTTEEDIGDFQEFRENNNDIMTGARYASALVGANGNFMTSWLKYSLPQIEKLLERSASNRTAE